MLRVLFRSYKPLIRFRKCAVDSTPEIPAKTVQQYSTPLYLGFRPAIDLEELDVINSGGKAPNVHWKKISLSKKK